MKIVVLILLSVCMSNINASEESEESEKAVEELNYSVATSFKDFDYGERYLFNGSVYTPLYRYLGGSISLSYSEFKGDDNYIDSKYSRIEFGLFARKSSVGKLGFKVLSNKTMYDLSRLEDRDTTSYRILGEKYFNDITIGVSRTYSDTTGINDAEYNSVYFDFIWYINSNLPVVARAGGMDAEDTYVIGFETQPSFTNNLFKIFVYYLETPDYESTTIGVRYYFGLKRKLIERDRKFSL